MIELKKVSCIFFPATVNERISIDNLSLKIPEGQFVTVIGSNGAGKSTLLKLISGENTISSGSLLIDESDVSRRSVEERSEQVSRVFQDPLLGTFGDLSVAENISIAEKRGKMRTLRRSLSKEKINRWQHLLEELNLGLETHLNTKMQLLSGGQRQAVSLLMATLAPAKILLLDEHTSALDPKTAKKILSITRKRVKNLKLTTLMVTHRLQDALDLGDRLILLHQGKVSADYSAEEKKTLKPEDLLKKLGVDVAIA